MRQQRVEEVVSVIAIVRNTETGSELLDTDWEHSCPMSVARVVTIE